MLGPRIKRQRAGLGAHFPDHQFPDVPEPILGIQTNNRAEAVACLNVLQVVPLDQNLHRLQVGVRYWFES